jgi:hypothetical protein
MRPRSKNSVGRPSRCLLAEDADLCAQPDGPIRVQGLCLLLRRRREGTSPKAFLRDFGRICSGPHLKFADSIVVRVKDREYRVHPARVDPHPALFDPLRGSRVLNPNLEPDTVREYQTINYCELRF